MRTKIPMRGTGADQPVGASKPGNAGGAKGLNGSADGMGQPAMGGIHAGGQVVRGGGHDDQESPSAGRKRCPKRSLARSPAAGSSEPDESRGSSPDPRGPGGAAAAGHSTQHLRAVTGSGREGPGVGDSVPRRGAPPARQPREERGGQDGGAQVPRLPTPLRGSAGDCP